MLMDIIPQNGGVVATSANPACGKKTKPSFGFHTADAHE